MDEDQDGATSERDLSAVPGAKVGAWTLEFSLEQLLQPARDGNEDLVDGWLEAVRSAFEKKLADVEQGEEL